MTSIYAAAVTPISIRAKPATPIFCLIFDGKGPNRGSLGFGLGGGRGSTISVKLDMIIGH